eukprot:scaffold82791_cov49-Attheya_sp.AAC.1
MSEEAAPAAPAPAAPDPAAPAPAEAAPAPADAASQNANKRKACHKCNSFEAASDFKQCVRSKSKSTKWCDNDEEMCSSCCCLSDNGSMCSSCNDMYCKKNCDGWVTECSKCEIKFCDDCRHTFFTCSHCDKVFCTTCFQDSAVCEHRACDSSKFCVDCKDDCLSRCEDCEDPTCKCCEDMFESCWARKSRQQNSTSYY